MKRFLFLDWIVFAYTVWVAVLVAVFRENVPGWQSVLAFHLVLLAVMPWIPARGAPWERSRGGLRFFRYSYPLLLILFFFEEVQQTVNAAWPDTPYWFENHLYAADRFVFGELPAVLLNPEVGLPQDEIVHAFYLSYYFIFVGSVVVAWLGSGRPHPGRGFQTTLTSIITGFFLCFVWYPLLPARGPWENPELMSTLTPFQGVVFTPIVEAIIAKGAVSGGCFPSSHIAASWAAVFGLARFHPRWAAWMGFLAAGMSFACVYTRYHHGVDVPAGFLSGLSGAIIASLFERPAERGRDSEIVLP